MSTGLWVSGPKHVRDRLPCPCARVPWLQHFPFLALFDLAHFIQKIPPKHHYVEGLRLVLLQLIADEGREVLLACASLLLNRNLGLTRLPHIQ